MHSNGIYIVHVLTICLFKMSKVKVNSYTVKLTVKLSRGKQFSKLNSKGVNS